MEKIKVLNTDAMDQIKSSRNKLEEVLRKVIIRNECSMEDIFGPNVFIDTDLDAEKFHLDTGKTRTEQAITLYKALKRLPPYYAVNERVWAAYTLGSQLDYMQYTFKDTEEKLDDSNGLQAICSRYFFDFTRKGWMPVVKNTLSGMWWAVYLSVDYNRKDPFELSRVMLGLQFRETFLQRNLCHNKTILHGLLQGILNLDNLPANHKKITAEEVAKFLQYLNLLGSSILVDCMTESEMTDLTQKWIIHSRQKAKAPFQFHD